MLLLVVHFFSKVSAVCVCVCVHCALTLNASLRVTKAPEGFSLLPRMKAARKEQFTRSPVEEEGGGVSVSGGVSKRGVRSRKTRFNISLRQETPSQKQPVCTIFAFLM